MQIFHWPSTLWVAPHHPNQPPPISTIPISTWPSWHGTNDVAMPAEPRIKFRPFCGKASAQLEVKAPPDTSSKLPEIHDMLLLWMNVSIIQHVDVCWVDFFVEHQPCSSFFRPTVSCFVNFAKQASNSISSMLVLLRCRPMNPPPPAPEIVER